MKYRVRHKPSGKWLWHHTDGHLSHCALVPCPAHPELKPSEWSNRNDALCASIMTCFGTRHMEIMEFQDHESPPDRVASKYLAERRKVLLSREVERY